MLVDRLLYHGTLCEQFKNTWVPWTVCTIDEISAATYIVSFEM